MDQDCQDHVDGGLSVTGEGFEEEGDGEAK
jgi:hypothetical protein